MILPRNSKVCVASLFYNPSHAAHLIAYAKAFSAVGSYVEFLLHPGYSSFDGFDGIAPVQYSNATAPQSLERFTHALVYNSAAGNPIFAWKMRRNGCKVAYIYHEPWGSFTRRWGGESLSSFSRLLVSRIFTRLTLAAASQVVLPSKEAWVNYELNDMKYNRNAIQMPLIFDDAFKDCPPRARTTFSYIGTISHAHGFDLFLDFARYAVRNNLGIKFLIASRTEVPSQTLAQYFGENYRDSVELRCGFPLSSEEINSCYAQSLCVWNLYRRSTQSGVMVNAFMCGAPVLASRTGAFLEFVQDGINGRFAEPANHGEIAQAFSDISAAIDQYSERCRRAFLNQFHFASQLDKIEQILHYN